MSWHAPTTVSEVCRSIERGWSFSALPFRLRGDNVAVLSHAARRGLGLDPGHAFSAEVTRSAEEYTDHYLVPDLQPGRGHRDPLPSTWLYYVSTFSRKGQLARVVLAVRADGLITSELLTTNMRLSSMNALLDAAEKLGQRFKETEDWS